MQAVESVVSTLSKAAATFDGGASAARELFATFLLPRLAPLLTRTPRKRRALLRLLYAFCVPMVADESYSSGSSGDAGAAAPGAGGLSGSGAASMQAVNLLHEALTTAAPPGSADITGLYVQCLASCIALETRVGEEAGDMYAYYASIGLAAMQPHTRAAAVSILASLVPHQPTMALRLLERVVDLREDTWWETQMQLARLIVALVRLLADAGASTAPQAASPSPSPSPPSTASGTRRPVPTLGGAGWAIGTRGSSTFDPLSPTANHAAALSLGLREEDLHSILGACVRIGQGVLALDPVPDVLSALACGLQPYMSTFPLLVPLFIAAMVALPHGHRTTLLSVDIAGGRVTSVPTIAAASPAPGGRSASPQHAPAASQAAVPVALVSGYGWEYDPVALAGPLSPSLLVASIAEQAHGQALQQLELGHFQLLVAALALVPPLPGAPPVPSTLAGGPGGVEAEPSHVYMSNEAVASLLEPLRKLRDYVFVGMCEPATCKIAARCLLHIFACVPGAASFLVAPTLVGSLLLLLQPPSGERHLESEEDVALMLRDVAARGHPFDKGVVDALSALGKRSGALLETSPLRTVLEGLA